MLNSDIISKRVISKLDSIGIDSSVDGKPSHTAELIKIIVSEIITAIKTSAEVNVVVNTVGTPTQHTGTGVGKVS